LRQRHGDFAIQTLRGAGMKIPRQFFNAAITSGLRTFAESAVKPISSSPSATNTKFTGSLLLAPRIACRRGEERCFRTFLVDGGSAHDDFPQSRPVNESGFEWREDHSAGSACFHVRTCSKGRECAERRHPAWRRCRAGVGGDFAACWNPASRSMRMVSSQPSFMPRFSAAMDGWRSPILQALDGFVVTLFDFRVKSRRDRRMRVRPARHRKGRSGSSGAL